MKTQNKPTVALQMIVKDEYDSVIKTLYQADPYFTEVNLTVSDKSTADKLIKFFTKHPDVTIQYRKWNNRFDEARNDNLKMCTSDYFFWLDADDEFPFGAIPQLVDIAEKEGVEAVFLPYNYLQDERGQSVTRHWRERLIKNNAGFEWRGWVHETCIRDEPYISHKVSNVEVKHNSDMQSTMASHARNHDILIEAYDATEDPRYLHYLGMSFYTLEDYKTAASLLSKYLEVGGSIEDSYRSLSIMSECAYHLKDYDLALEYATKCATLKPEYPQAYWLLAQYESDQGNYPEALEWTKTGLAKPDPDTLAVYDPSQRERAIYLAAEAEYRLQNFNAALQWLRKIPNSTYYEAVYDAFKEEADLEAFFTLLPKTRQFYNSDKELFYSLSPSVRYDKRLQPLRYLVEEPKKWAGTSIVIFCGQGYEEWGPQTLNKGMGGSEEAVVYLAPELARLGYDVTVYGEYDSGDTDIVKWRPWQELDSRDEFNIFVSWRAPQFLEKVNAKVKLCDVHDLIPTELVKDYPDATYLFKSNWHKEQYPDLPDNKSVVIGNGIKKEQF